VSSYHPNALLRVNRVGHIRLPSAERTRTGGGRESSHIRILTVALSKASGKAAMHIRVKFSK